MPIYLEISRLHRTVTIVARGKIAPDEVQGLVQQLADAHIHAFAKVVDVASATSADALSPEQIARFAVLLRGDGRETRGPLAFIIDPDRDDGFARTYAKLTESEGRVSLFRSLHEARAWVEQVQRGPVDDAIAARAQRRAHSPWSDPQRRGLLLRGGRQRAVTASLVGA
ncbi:MAG: hypothetical protein JSR91_04625 [Proteobacteria bacterium]|nr:hypothetical protein [Pseudomonadota bacterium]